MVRTTSTSKKAAQPDIGNNSIPASTNSTAKSAPGSRSRHPDEWLTRDQMAARADASGNAGEDLDEHFTTSTPLTTPNATILGQVDGISNPIISTEGTDSVGDRLKEILSDADHFETLEHQDNWFNTYHLEHDKIQAKIDSVENDCLSKGLRTQVRACTDLRTRVTTQKTSLDEKAASLRTNPRIQAIRASEPLTPSGGAVSKNQNRITDPLFSEELDQLTANLSSQSSPVMSGELSTQAGILPSTASDAPRNISIGGVGDIRHSSIGFSHLTKRITGLENKLKMMPFDPRVEARLKSLEDKLVTPEDMQQLRTECVTTVDYNTDYVPRLTSLETAVNQVKEQSETNWTVASGCATRILSNKKELSDLKQNVLSLQEQVQQLTEAIQTGQGSQLRAPVQRDQRIQLPNVSNGVYVPRTSAPTSHVTTTIHTRPLTQTGLRQSVANGIVQLDANPSNSQGVSAPRFVTPGMEERLHMQQVSSSQYVPSRFGQGHGRPSPPQEVDDDRFQPDSPDSGSSGLTGISGAAHLSNQGKRLKRDSRNLKLMLDPKVNDPSLSKVLVESIHKDLLRSVSDETKELRRALERYESSMYPNSPLIEEADDAISAAQAWIKGMRAKYRELECGKKSLDTKLYEGLGKFGDDSDMNIFEFLGKFEAYTSEQGSAKERATLLYEQYLHKDVQLELVDRAHDYKLMRGWLISRFGDIKIITDNILKIVARETMPGDFASNKTLTAYYRKLNSAIKKVQGLSKTVDMPIEELNAHIYSAEFIAKLIKYVPRLAVNAFMDKLVEKGIDTHRIHGQRPFKHLAFAIFSKFSSCSGAAQIEELTNTSKPPRPQKDKASSQKSVHTAHKEIDDLSGEESEGVSESDSESEDQVSCSHAQSATPKKQAAQSAPRQKIRVSISKFKFPCTLNGHDHEVGDCTEFFTTTPSDRQTLGMKKICFTCLGPHDKCPKSCSNLKTIPKLLICEKCKEWADKNKRSPLNVLYCKNKKHQKPDNQKLLDALKDWVKGFNPSKVKAPVQLAAHLNVVAHVKNCSRCGDECKCMPVTKSSSDAMQRSVPALNTATGEVMKVREDQIIHEVAHDSFYVMQILMLNGQECLTFYDRGANMHLIDGPLAEEVGARLVHNKPARIGVVGGGHLWSEYGRYSVMLGPTQAGNYHSITAQGVSLVTKKFPRYNLQEINKELLNSGALPKGQFTLPKYIGGKKVKLIVGIKDTELEPHCLFQLPSGVGVYKSPLTDMFGSNICYGGPHKIFSDVNKNCKGNLNHVNVFFTQMVNQYKNSPYSALSSSLLPEMEEGVPGLYHVTESTPKYRLFTETGMSVYPTPLSSADFNEAGSNEIDETEDDVIDYSSTCLADTKAAYSSKVEHCHHIDSMPCVHKAKVPLLKLKEFMDQEDIGNAINYRCSDCLKCKKCNASDRVKMMSLQEQIEQEVIEKSVELDMDQKKVFIDLPFIKPPEEYLTKKHKSSDNYGQAAYVYKSICKTSEEVKEGVRKMHTDLVQQGFLKKLTDLSSAQQKIIRENGFRHYMPWRYVQKQDSLSTPVRLIVDPSMSGLNMILAKGTNNLTKINSILIRNRCRRHVWTSDVSKLYNHLVLKDTALPYGLFLYDESLDADTKLNIYVLMVGWYGVTSTGNQSGEALEKLCKELKEEFPMAYPIIVEDRYVDDIFSGSNSKDEADEQIVQVQSAIQHGNFPLKFVVKSGEKPSEIASSDGETVKVLGYKWKTQNDTLSPGFSELNFNKKRRGAKAPNPFVVNEPSDVSKLLSSKTVTQRIVTSKLSEIYDPLGLWEPFKLQLKLEAQGLNGIEWDAALEPDVQEHWKSRFKDFLQIPFMTADRCIIPENAANPDKIRLICISDAAVAAGGCAIYGTYLTSDGTYSCKLLAAKSRRMNGSIPRNELEGVRVMAEMALDVRHALGELVEEVLFFTDSTIAMSWCHNLNKKLRLYVLNRVSEIRRLITECAGESAEFPLYHIEGKDNLADLLTKPHEITPEDLGIGSTWQNGLHWMRLSLDDMPITRYTDISVNKEEQTQIDAECFFEPSFTADSVHLTDGRLVDASHCQGCTEGQCKPNQAGIPHHHLPLRLYNGDESFVCGASVTHTWDLCFQVEADSSLHVEPMFEVRSIYDHSP